LKSVLQAFEIHNKLGFDQNILARSAEILGKTFMTTFEGARNYRDLSYLELINNFRFLRITFVYL
jgi:hypothetical protein